MPENEKRWVPIVLAAMLALAVLPLPYGYYTLLRLVVFGGGIYYAYQLWQTKRTTAYLLAGLAVLFNPLFPIYLSREIWLPINLVGAGLFAYVALLTRSASENAATTHAKKETLL